MTRGTEQALAVDPDGTWRMVPLGYEGIKEGLRGATMDFLAFNPECGYFLDDEGMLDNSPLNVPASIFAGWPIYGAAVLCAADPDDEGNSLPASERAVRALKGLAHLWASARAHAADMGQDLTIWPQPENLPPPRVVAMTHEEFGRFLGG